MSYPDSPGFKDSGTSREAAMSIDAATMREMALAEIRKTPLTADEVADRLGISVLSIRPRVSELYRQGFIRKTEQRRFNRSGRRAVVWA